MKMNSYIRFEQIFLVAVVVIVIASGAPVLKSSEENDQSNRQAEKVEIAADKPKEENAAKTEEKTTLAPPKETTIKTVAKSPEVAEPPETGSSGNVEKRSAGPPVLDTEMPAGAGTPDAHDLATGDDEALSEEDYYLRAILSDPQLVKDILDEETRLRYFQRVSPELDVDLTPTSMAWYLLATGDIEGVTRMINALVAYSALSLDEARDYRMAVEEEYAQLSQAGIRGLSNPESMLSAQEYEDVDYTAAVPYPVGIPAFPLPVEYETNVNQRESQDYPHYLSSLVGQTEESDNQKSDEDYYYDGIMKELLEVMAKENTENKVEKLPEVAESSEKSRPSDKQEVSASNSQPVQPQAQLPSLEDELEGLFRGNGKENSSPKFSQTEKVAEDEMSVEEQLEQLLGGRQQIGDSSTNKQKQDNRTLPSLELKTLDKKDNEKKA